MHEYFVTLALPTALALFAAACSDAPTGPALAPPEAALSTQAAGPNPLAPGQVSSPYACFTSVRTPGGPHNYRYGRLNLQFPQEALAPGGATLRYRYRGYANGAELNGLANCVIPRTREAVAMMHRRFGIPGSGKAGSGGSSSGEVGVMTEPVKEEELVVTACQYGGTYPDCQSAPAPSGDEPTYGDGSDRGSDRGGGSGGGSGGGDEPCTSCEPDAPVTNYTPVTDDEVQDTLPPDCNQTATLTELWQKAYCKGAAPTGTLLDKYNKELNDMEKIPGCEELAKDGRQLLTDDKVRYYSSNSTDLRGWGHSNIGIIIDKGFANNAKPYHHQFSLAHELEHAKTGYKHTDADRDALGVYHTPNDTKCGG